MFISWKHFLDFMGKALEVVNQYYDFSNNKNFTALKELLAEKMSFTGPKEYVDALSAYFPICHDIIHHSELYLHICMIAEYYFVENIL